MPQNVIVDNNTKVGDLSKAIDIWQKIEKTASSPEERRIARENLQKQTQAKANLVNIIESKLGKLSEENKYKISPYIGDTSKNRYDKLSIELLNGYLDTKDQVDYMEQTNPSDSLGMKILEGKTGVDYMTVVKSTLAVSAVSLLAQAGTFSALSSGLSALMAFNPVVGACAVVLGTASLIRMARKIFAPEIKKLVSNVRVQEKFDQLSAESEEKYELPDFDAYRKGYTEGTPDKETPLTKPGEAYDANKFKAYRDQIINEAYEAAKKGEVYNAPYGQNVISDDDVQKCVTAGIKKAQDEKAAAEKEAREKAEAEEAAKKSKTKKTTTTEETAEAEEESHEEPEIVTAKMVNKAESEAKKAATAQKNAETAQRNAQTAYDKAQDAYNKTQDKETTKDLEEARNKLRQCNSELEAAKEAAAAATKKHVELRAKFNELNLENKPAGPAPVTPKTPVAEPTTPAPETAKTEETTERIENTTAEPLLLKASLADRYKKVTAGINPNQKKDGQEEAQTAYNAFMNVYKQVLGLLAEGKIQGIPKGHANNKNNLKNVDMIIENAKNTALKSVENTKFKESYEDLFSGMEDLIKFTMSKIAEINADDKDKENKAKNIVREQLHQAGFDENQIKQQLGEDQ